MAFGFFPKQEPIPVHAGTCALCVYHWRVQDKGPCITCPLYKVLGHECDVSSEGPDGSAPYQVWLSFKDPEPMIKALEKALEAQNESSV